MGAIVSKLTFRPPSHATYNDVDGKMLFIRKKSGAKRGEIMEEDLIYLKTSTGNTIPALFFRQDGAKYTILYSHANMEDLGLTARFCSEMSDFLQQNVFVYDYTGYGLSSGKPSEKNVYADIDAAYDYLVNEVGYKPESIIPMGRSVGSGPSVDLAARCVVGGLILVCPLTSCVRVTTRVQSTPVYDMFASIDKIHRVRCHVLVVHGKNDTTVPVEHGIQLCRKARCSASPLWLEGANHNDLETDFKLVILARYRDFLQQLDQTQPRTPREKLSSLRDLQKRPVKLTPMKSNRAIVQFTEMDDNCVISVQIFELENQLHIFLESSNPNNSMLSRLKERTALVIVFRLLCILCDAAGPSVHDTSVTERLSTYEYGLSLPEDEEKQYGSWAYIRVEQSQSGFPMASWIAGVVLFWFLSGQEAFLGKGGVNAACTGNLSFGSEWSQVSSDCKLLVRRMLISDGSQRITAQEATAHRVFNDIDSAPAEITKYTEVDEIVTLLRDQHEKKRSTLGCLYLVEGEELSIPELCVTDETIVVGQVLHMGESEGRLASAGMGRHPKNQEHRNSSNQSGVVVEDSGSRGRNFSVRRKK